MKINLHIHTNKSLEGEKTPTELLKILKENGYDIVSITDHDSCEAYKNILDDFGLKLITGIEADGMIGNCTYDFLCYGFELDEVYEYALKKYETIDKRQQKIFNELVKKAQEKHINLTNIESYDPYKEYAHAAIFRMLDDDFKEKYQLLSVTDLYRKGTTDINFPLFIDMHIVWPDIKELLDIIHKNHGKVFLAHPYRYNRDVLEVLQDAKDYVDGIEICNQPSSKDEVEFLYNYAKENNLLVSCGSDYRGDELDNINCEYLTNEMINDILSWIE